MGWGLGLMISSFNNSPIKSSPVALPGAEGTLGLCWEGWQGLVPILGKILGFLGCPEGSAANTRPCFGLLRYFWLNGFIYPQSRDFMGWQLRRDLNAAFKNTPEYLPESLRNIPKIALRWGL